jgi:hypothetical protein
MMKYFTIAAKPIMVETKLSTRGEAVGGRVGIILGGGKASDTGHKAILGHAVGSDTLTEAKLATMKR